MDASNVKPGSWFSTSYRLLIRKTPWHKTLGSAFPLKHCEVFNIHAEQMKSKSPSKQRLTVPQNRVFLSWWDEKPSGLCQGVQSTGSVSLPDTWPGLHPLSSAPGTAFVPIHGAEGTWPLLWRALSNRLYLK